MHKYLSAIGFKHIETREQLNKLLRFTEVSFQSEKTVKIGNNLEIAERTRHFTKDMGIMIQGSYDEKDRYEREYYIPFFYGKGNQKFDDLAIERHISKNSYAGACEYPNIGITIIFYLQNAVEYLSELKFRQFDIVVYMVGDVLSPENVNEMAQEILFDIKAVYEKQDEE